MTDRALDRMPSARAVVLEQLRVVGLAVRREALLVGTILGVLGLILVFLARTGAVVVDGRVNEELPLDPGEVWSTLAALMAVLFALAVWKGERPFGDTPLWSVPVDHVRHALTRVTAGWLWLMALLGAAWLWMVILALASRGSLGVEEVRILILDPAGALAGTPGATAAVDWHTPWWEWVMPFTAATAGYLFASALILGTAHPVAWGLGLWFAALGMGGLVHPWGVEWVNRIFDSALWTLGVWDGLVTSALGASGERVRAWRAMPSVGMWAASTAVWIGLGLAGVLAALARPRDH